MVDPRGSREREDFGVGGGGETFGVFRAGCSEGCRAFLGYAGGVAVVEICGRVEADAGVLVMMVVPVHKTADECSGVVDRGEAFGEFRTVFQSLEQRLSVIPNSE